MFDEVNLYKELRENCNLDSYGNRRFDRVNDKYCGKNVNILMIFSNLCFSVM